MRKFILVMFAFFVMLVATSFDKRIKRYETFYVDEGDIIDCNAMMKPPKKYTVLMRISAVTRRQVAEHMQANHFKLKSGKQSFIKNNPTYEELVTAGFAFEKID